MVDDLVDATGVGTIGVAVDFHEEEDGSFVLVVCSGVPSPRCEIGIGVKYGGALTYCEVGLDEPR